MDIYKEELRLIRERQKPLLGVCVGFQVIAVALGGTLQYRTESVRGVIDINVTVPTDAPAASVTSSATFTFTGTSSG